MKTRKPAHSITHEDVQRAIERFKAQGGLIKRLPDEVVPPRTLVGTKWAEYEPIYGTAGEAGGEPAAA
jgi:hypothetical protein